MSFFRKAKESQLKPKTQKELWVGIGKVAGQCILYTVGGYILGYTTVYAMYFVGRVLGLW